MGSTFNIGQVVRAAASFTTSTGSTATKDPGRVTFQLEKPDGASSTWTSTSTSVVKVTTGQYRIDITTTARGRYEYEWFSTGNSIDTKTQGYWSVRPDRV